MVRDLPAFRSALLDHNEDQVEVAFSELDLCSPACDGVTVAHSMRIVAVVPATWKLSSEAPVELSNGSTLEVSGFNLLSSEVGPDAILSDAWILGSDTSVLFDTVRLISRVSGETSMGGLHQPLNGTFNLRQEDNSRVFYRNSELVSDDSGCFETGRPVYSVASLRDALWDASVANISIIQNISVGRSDFPRSGLEGMGSVSIAAGRNLRIRGCNGVVLDVQFVDRSVFFQAGSSLTMEGDIRIANALPSLADDWGKDNYAFVGFFSISPNASATFRYVTILGDTANPFFDRLYVELLTEDVRPAVQWRGPAQAVVTLNRTRAAWEAYAHERASYDVGFWALENVTLEGSSRASICYPGALPAVPASSGGQLAAALENPEVEAVHVTGDIVLDLGEDAETRRLLGNGLNLTRPVLVYTCEETTFDTGNLFEAVYVRTGGYLKFRGPFRFVNVFAAVRRSFNVVLLGFLSVEVNGLIELQGATIVGRVPGFLQSATHLFRHTATDELLPRGREAEVVNATHSRLVNWRFVVNDWVRVSRGIDLGETGFWQFVNVLETWEEEGGGNGGGRRIVIAAAAAGAALLAAAAVGFWLYRRSRRLKASQPAAVPAAAAQSPLQPAMQDASTPMEAALSLGLQARCNTPSCTGDMIMDAKRALLEAGATLADSSVKLNVLLGKGTFGKVYKGTWKGSKVAIKTLLLPGMLTGQEKQERMALMETVVGSYLKHPNIVQMFTFGLRPVLELPDSMSSIPGGRTFSIASWPPMEGGTGTSTDSSGGTQISSAQQWELLLVMEYCDGGSLRAALNKGAFSNADGSKNMEIIVRTATGIARAMLHLHSENVVHGDLKASNILLQSAAGGSFVPKVSDFGLSVRLDPNDTHVSDVNQGTMTHMAPEVLVEGKLSRAADVYAYGILLWELYTAERAFKDAPHALLGHQVAQQGRRPDFPDCCPFAYQRLACSCWDAAPTARPTVKHVLDSLEQMRLDLQLEIKLDVATLLSDSRMASSIEAGTDSRSTPAETQALEETLPLDSTELFLDGSADTSPNP